MDEQTRRKVRRLRIWFSIIPIVLGLAMIALIPTDFGPTPTIGFVFGGVLVAYGTVRLILTLRG